MTTRVRASAENHYYCRVRPSYTLHDGQREHLHFRCQRNDLSSKNRIENRKQRAAGKSERD